MVAAATRQPRARNGTVPSSREPDRREAIRDTLTPMIAARTLLLAAILFCVGCAVHSPERAAREFVRRIGRPATATGSNDFDQISRVLQLHEEAPKKGVYRRSAAW